MNLKITYTLLAALLLFFGEVSTVFAQQDRFEVIEQRLNMLAATEVPGLMQKVDISVSGIPLEEFIRGLADANDLNINVDPNLNVLVYNNFTNESVANILLFLIKKYNLDIQFFGSIMSISKYAAPPEPAPVFEPKEISLIYDADNDLLTMDLNADTIGAIAKKITALSGKNVILAPDARGALVTTYIKDMPFESALSKMAFGAGLEVNKTEDNFYILQKKAPEPSPNVQLPGRQNNNQQWQIPEGLTIEIAEDINGNELITVDAINIPIADLIKAVSKELDQNYFLFAEPQGNTTLNITNSTYEQFLERVLQTTQHTYNKQKGVYLIGERSMEGLRNTQLIQLQFRSADKIIDIIPGQLKKNVELQVFPELNSIILSGSHPQINEIEIFLKKIDQVVPVILIEVMIVDISRNRTIKTGIEAGIDETRKSGGTLLPSLDFTLSSEAVNQIIEALNGTGLVNLGKVTPDFYLALSALEAGGYIHINSTPKLSTLNGHPATMSIGQTTYYIERTTNVIGSLSPQTVEGIRYVPLTANMALSIQPIVSGDEHVTLDIQVEISDFGDRVGEQGPPSINSSQFQSLIRVRNEEMIVLGGLERRVNSNTGEGLPFLARIPVIKWLFGKNEKVREKRRFNVFIKPTIIY